MNGKKIIWIIGIVLLAFIVMHGISSIQEFKQKIPLMDCMDYEYFMELEGEFPVEVTFYTLDNGEEEFFKKEIFNEKDVSTLLHCGHDYKAVYSFTGYEDFIDYISVPESNPLIKKTTKIEI